MKLPQKQDRKAPGAGDPASETTVERPRWRLEEITGSSFLSLGIQASTQRAPVCRCLAWPKALLSEQD